MQMFFILISGASLRLEKSKPSRHIGFSTFRDAQPAGSQEGRRRAPVVCDTVVRPVHDGLLRLLRQVVSLLTPGNSLILRERQERTSPVQPSVLSRSSGRKRPTPSPSPTSGSQPRSTSTPLLVSLTAHSEDRVRRRSNRRTALRATLPELDAHARAHRLGMVGVDRAVRSWLCGGIRAVSSRSSLLKEPR